MARANFTLKLVIEIFIVLFDNKTTQMIVRNFKDKLQIIIPSKCLSTKIETGLTK